MVSLHMFYNTTAEEAFTREACMIDAVGEKEGQWWVRCATIFLCMFYRPAALEVFQREDP